MKMEKLRNKMHLYIQKYGINSKEVLEISKEIDVLITKEFKTQICGETMRTLIEYSAINDFPSTKEWDEYAKQNGYLSHISLKYKLGLKWNEIKNLVISKIL